MTTTAAANSTGRGVITRLLDHAASIGILGLVVFIVVSKLLQQVPDLNIKTSAEYATEEVTPDQSGVTARDSDTARSESETVDTRTILRINIADPQEVWQRWIVQPFDDLRGGDPSWWSIIITVVVILLIGMLFIPNLGIRRAVLMVVVVLSGIWLTSWLIQLTTTPATIIAPVGVWSSEEDVTIGCGVRFAAGHGDWYKVRYRLYNTPYRDHITGLTESMSHFQYMFLKERENPIPYREVC